MDDEFSPKILDVYSLSNIRGPSGQNNSFIPLNNHVNTSQQPTTPYREISPKTINYNAPSTRDFFNSMPLDSWARWVQNQPFVPHNAIPPRLPEKTELHRAMNANKPVYPGANPLTGCVQNSGKISNTVGHVQQTIITKPNNESLNLPVNLSSGLQVGYHTALINPVLNTSKPSINNSSRQAVNSNSTTSSANSISHNNISNGGNDKNVNNVQMYNSSIVDKNRINKEGQKLESSGSANQFNPNISIKVEESVGHDSTQDCERNLFEHRESSKLISQKETNENSGSKEVECEITKIKNLKQRLCETSSVKVKEEPKSPNREVEEGEEENGETQETSRRVSTRKKGTKSSSIVVTDDELDDHESENEVKDDSSDSEYIPDDDEASSDDGSLDEDDSRRIIHSLRKPPINRIFDTSKKSSNKDKEDKDKDQEEKEKSGKDKKSDSSIIFNNKLNDKDKKSGSSIIFNCKPNALLGRNLLSKASPADHVVFSKSEELGLSLSPYLKILKKKLTVNENNNNNDLTEKSERGKFIGKLKPNFSPYYRPILPKGTEARVAEQQGKEERSFSLPNIISSSRIGNKPGEPSKDPVNVIIDLTKPGSPSLNTLLEKFQLSKEKIKQITKSLTSQTSNSEKQTLTNFTDLEKNTTSNNISNNAMNLECEETISVTEDRGNGEHERSVSNCDFVTEITGKQSSSKKQTMNPEKSAENNITTSVASNVNQNMKLNKKQVVNIGKSQIILNSLNKDIQVKLTGNDDTNSIVSSTMNTHTPVASNMNLTSTSSRSIINAISTNSTDSVMSSILQTSDNLPKIPGKCYFLFLCSCNLF